MKLKEVFLKTVLSFNYIALILFAVLQFSSFKVADSDFWTRMACGSLIINTGWVLPQDTFSFVATKPIWVDHEWLSGILFFLTYKFLSDFGILILKLFVLITTILFLLITANLRYESKKNILFYGLILLGMFPAFGSNIRPHDFTYLFFTFWLFILEYSRLKDTTKYLFILPLSIILWTNLHAGCLAGLALLSVYCFSQFIQKKSFKPYLIALIISAIAMIINPYGYHYYIYIFNELTASHTSIAEWHPVDIFKVTDFIIFKIIFILTVIGYIFSKLDRKDPVSIILLVTLGLLGFKVGRHNILFVIVAGIFAFPHIHSSVILVLKYIKDKVNTKIYANIVFIVQYVPAWVVFALSIYYLPSQNIMNWSLALPQADYPIKAVEVMKVNSIKANLLLPFGWGGYVTWLLYPNVKVSADGRFVVIFDEKIFELTNNFYYARDNWNEIFTRYPVNAILIEKKAPIFKKINEIKNYKIVFSDKYTVLLLKNDYNLIKPIIPKYLNDKFFPNLSDSYFMRL